VQLYGVAYILFSVENRRRETLFELLSLAYTKKYVVKLKEKGHEKDCSKRSSNWNFFKVLKKI
jgi:hypothetical protein